MIGLVKILGDSLRSARASDRIVDVAPGQISADIQALRVLVDRGFSVGNVKHLSAPALVLNVPDPCAGIRPISYMKATTRRDLRQTPGR
ncbi:hypothetical protein ACFYO1_07045 [Nocardia sp. NPDC006044]|uniref:hypothetical protein n=1 Tax=Nocardia sp. NPDC006044 TaxID=3364306 RepID=UPI0036C3CFCD